MIVTRGIAILNNLLKDYLTNWETLSFGGKSELLSILEVEAFI